MQSIIRYRDLVLPISIIGCVVVILTPLPTAVLDILIAANITVAVLVLLTTIHVEKPLDFSVFPTLLLATTLARLVLNVATTRLILTGADRHGVNAAGSMIESFGTFVAGDRIEVGLIIFIILIVIQFVVITKGATRISEVAARFALDGMPGKQMAIDSDLNAGVIDEHTAQKRREEISEQADFYGTMDGASKFVRGDAIAAIIITLVNIVGGLYVGVVHSGMSVPVAASTFTKLTIGDGLVSQLPALLISLAAGFLVTRSSKRANLPVQLLQQLLGNSRALTIAGGFLLLLVITNLPPVPVVTLGAGCVGLALVVGRQQQQQVAEEQSKLAAAEADASVKKPRIEDLLAVDPMEISIGLGLLNLADPTRGGDLMERITRLRQSLALDLGIILPKVRVRDDRALDDYGYRIQIHGNVVIQNDLVSDKILASAERGVTGQIQGLVRSAEDSPLGFTEIWIRPEQCEQAAVFGYTLREPVQVLVDELEEVSKQYADELLSRDATKHLLDEMQTHSPMVVEELVPKLLRVSDVQHVLQMLLKEDVPIRQMTLILEALGDIAVHTSDLEELVEAVRQRLSRTISDRYRDSKGHMHVLTLDPELESQITRGLEKNSNGTTINWSPVEVDMLLTLVREGIANLPSRNKDPLLLVNPKIRFGVQALIGNAIPGLRVLSFREICDQTRVKSHGVICLPTEVVGVA